MKRTVIGIALYPNYGSNLAEMEGFEPPHALQRLADFESAPFSHLGTSPKTCLLYQQNRKKSSFFLIQMTLFYHFQYLRHITANTVIVFTAMGTQASGTIFDPIFCITEASAAFFAKTIQRTVAEQAAKSLRICPLVAREKLAFPVLEKIIMRHNTPQFILLKLFSFLKIHAIIVEKEGFRESFD